MGLKTGGRNQRGAVETFTSRAVKEDRIAIGFPDSGELHRSGAMKTEVDSAGPIAPHEYAFCDVECIDLQFVLITQRLVDVFAKLSQIVKTKRFSHDRGADSFLRKRADQRGKEKESECQQELLSAE